MRVVVLIITRNQNTSPSSPLMKTWVLKFLLVLSILHTIEASFLDTYNWVSIDCGAESTTLDVKNMINWEMDADYIKTGENKNVSGNGNGVDGLMKTLRSFPDGDTNCYKFSVDGITKYLVRARFYYGNYDGLSSPPSFDVAVNGLKWTTVVTSLSEDPMVMEGVFSPGFDVLRVCLVREMGGGVPFISSLEVTPWPFNTYREVDLYKGFLLQSRISFGGKEDVRYNGNYTGDELNRIWKAEGLPNYRNISSTPSYIGYIPNQPPDSVVVNAIEAPTPSDSILIPLSLPNTLQSLCVMLYFVELNSSLQASDSRKFQIFVGGQKNLTVELKTPQSVSMTVERVDGPTNITISPVEGSTLPPILNAMEVYTTMDMPNPFSPTSQAGGLSSPFLVLLLVFVFCVVVM